MLPLGQDRISAEHQPTSRSASAKAAYGGRPLSETPPGAAACSMRRSILLQVMSHDILAKKASARRSSLPRGSTKAASQAAMKWLGVSAMRARPSTEYGRTTSRMEVETTGLPAARYSGVFVGLMKRVASFLANGIRATSQPAM